MRTGRLGAAAGIRRHRMANGALACVFAAAALAGCTAGPATSDVVSPTSPPYAADADARPYPAGASADTPECQDASPAVLAAVNATIDNTLPGGSNTVPSLTATPDPEHAVWLLTGAIPSTGTAGGFLVSWATTADPTQATFGGNLRSVGGQTATISSAPVLQFPDVAAPGGFPAAALACAAAPPRDASR